MKNYYNPAQLQSACRVLFGNDVYISPDFIHYLQPSGLYDAYKRAAMKNHPDRAQQCNIPECVLSQRFKTVQESYELLHTYLSQRTTSREYAQYKDGGKRRWPQILFKWFKN